MPTLKRLLGKRYGDFMTALGEAAPLRFEANAGLIGEGTVANTLGYRGAFVAFGRDGSVFAVIKGGRHGTLIERFGRLDPARQRDLFHAYQEFAGLDE